MENNNEPLNLNRAVLSDLNKWTGYVGIMTIVSGIIACIGAIGSFGLSLIPGIITIILGVKLRNAKKSLDDYLNGNNDGLNNTLLHLASYFKIQGILLILALVLSIIAIVFGGLMMFMFIDSGFDGGMM